MTVPVPSESNNRAFERLFPAEERPSPARPPGNADSNRIVVEALEHYEKVKKIWEQEDRLKDPYSVGRDDSHIPAFPCQVSPTHEGMTLRDYFAGQALIGRMSGGMWEDVKHEQNWIDSCYEIADMMLKAREVE